MRSGATFSRPALQTPDVQAPIFHLDRGIQGRTSFVPVDIHAHDMTAGGRKAGARHQAHIPRSENGYPHVHVLFVGSPPAPAWRTGARGLAWPGRSSAPAVTVDGLPSGHGPGFGAAGG